MRKVSNAEELLELIRRAVRDVDHGINEAISNLKEAMDYAEDIEYIYANDLYNLAERGKEEREINATSLDLLWTDNTDEIHERVDKLVNHFVVKRDQFLKAKNVRIRFYEILEEDNEQNYRFLYGYAGGYC